MPVAGSSISPAGGPATAPVSSPTWNGRGTIKMRQRRFCMDQVCARLDAGRKVAETGCDPHRDEAPHPLIDRWTRERVCVRHGTGRLVLRFRARQRALPLIGLCASGETSLAYRGQGIQVQAAARRPDQGPAGGVTGPDRPRHALAELGWHLRAGRRAQVGSLAVWHPVELLPDKTRILSPSPCDTFPYYISTTPPPAAAAAILPVSLGSSPNPPLVSLCPSLFLPLSSLKSVAHPSPPRPPRQHPPATAHALTLSGPCCISDQQRCLKLIVGY
jgi:hypothetical protein